jgi:hypothetical protein
MVYYALMAWKLIEQKCQYRQKVISASLLALEIPNR